MCISLSEPFLTKNMPICFFFNLINQYLIKVAPRRCFGWIAFHFSDEAFTNVPTFMAAPELFLSTVQCQLPLWVRWPAGHSPASVLVMCKKKYLSSLFFFSLWMLLLKCSCFNQNDLLIRILLVVPFLLQQSNVLYSKTKWKGKFCCLSKIEM